MVSSVLCFPTKSSGMIHQGVCNIFKIPLLLFSRSQQGCAFFSGVELFAVENKQSLFLWFLTSLWDMVPSRKPAVPVWESASAFMLSCRLCWINEVLQYYREKGAWRNREWDHTAGIDRRGFISCHIVHSGCVWNQICYNNRNPLMETCISDPNPCFTKLWDLRVPIWRRELANLSIWGDLTASPGRSCWEDGGFDRCYKKII